MIVKLRPFLAVLFLSLALLPSTATQAAPPKVGNCDVFPADNPWNTDISGADVAANSAAIMTNIRNHGGDFVHPDFGRETQYYFRWITVSGTQKKVPISFLYDDESDPGPYPFPPNAPIEPGGGDRHVIVVDTDNCILYETYASVYQGGPQQAWHADSGAIYNLNSNALRPDTWTSADAAGLPIFPGLARCSEVQAGAINHALRVTFSHTRDTYIYPATHEAGDPDVNAPPMGLRFRMRADFDTSGFTGQSLVVVTALKKYGLINADNGSNWYISGEQSTCWDSDDLEQLKDIPDTAFEVIDSPAPLAPTTPPAPSLYSPADGAGVTGGQPLLGWNTVTSATSYEVYLDQNPTPTTKVATISSTQLTQYLPTIPLTSGFTYYWRVRALTPNGTTGYSPTRSYALASPANIAPPRNLYNDSTPSLTWNLVSWAVNYHIQIGTNSAFTGTLNIDDETLAASQLSYTVPNNKSLTDGTYYWRIQAKNASGVWGAWSAVESFIVDA